MLPDVNSSSGVTAVGTERRRSLYEMNEMRRLSFVGVRWEGIAAGGVAAVGEMAEGETAAAGRTTGLVVCRPVSEQCNGDRHLGAARLTSSTGGAGSSSVFHALNHPPGSCCPVLVLLPIGGRFNPATDAAVVAVAVAGVGDTGL
jgi:hypothetical protein